jgi:hypothetical protein
MENQPRHTALAHWLKAHLQSGLSVTEDVLAYAEASFGTGDLAVVLTGEADSEIDSLMELVFFPDRNTQIQYERQWGDIRFSPADLDAVIQTLCLGPLDVPLLELPEASSPLVVRAPDFALAAFVERLKITWRPPDGLVPAIQHHNDEHKRLSLRVCLRNARLGWHTNQAAMMRRFLSIDSDNDFDDEQLTGFLLTLLPDLSPAMDHFDFLVAKKFFFFQSLCKAEEFERKRQSSNMETLMLQGARSAHGSIDAWRKNMRRIDQLCQAMFGRSRFFQQPTEQCIDFQNENSRETMQHVMRALS